MELNPVQRSAAFIAVVLVLAGLGVYLFFPSSSAASDRGGAPRSSGGTHSPPATSPASPAPSGQGAANIFQSLPFTQVGLSAAAATTEEFAMDYGTFSYTQSTQAYLAPMRPLMTGQLAVVL